MFVVRMLWRFEWKKEKILFAALGAFWEGLPVDQPPLGAKHERVPGIIEESF